jgi:Flp pilus assembly protein TadG
MLGSLRRPRDARGQVLVMVAILLVILLAFAGLAIDVGRQSAEHRHIQTAADAAALAACRALIDGASDNAAAADARQTARVNLEHSPAGATATISDSLVYEDGHAGDPSYLSSGVLISGTSVRVAISSTLGTTLGKVVGVQTMGTSAHARCGLQGSPALPLVARRYLNAPGPGNGFVDTVATSGTSAVGQIDTVSPTGYDTRTPASEANPGPPFDLYGPNSKASNDSSFRGFVALDVRNFESTTSRLYYNGVTSGTTVNTLKTTEGDYIIDGYDGPSFPSVTNPADPNDQIATLSGNDTSMVVSNFAQRFAVGDRVLLALYNGTVMQIPDFAISPPASIDIPMQSPPAATVTNTVNGPTFTVSRNDAFNSTVTLHLHGDTGADAIGHPEWDLLEQDPPTNAAPPAGQINMPIWSTDVFIPAKNGTRVTSSNLSANAVTPGIYTVWIEGHSGNPYYQSRRYPVPVRVGGATEDFSFENSTVSGSTATLGGTVPMDLYLSTKSGSGGWSGGAVTLGVDAGSFTDCSFNAAAIGAGQITLSSSSLMPSSSGNGALSTVSVNTSGLAAGCYRFNVRGYGMNSANQPVVHVQPVTFTVATSASSGSYVDIIGFAVFEVTDVGANSISVQAVSGVSPDPADQSLRRAQQARLIPW